MALLFQFAGTLSDGLGKTMDNRHQTEREYIRYHAATSGEHLVAGIHGLAHGKLNLFHSYSNEQIAKNGALQFALLLGGELWPQGLSCCNLHF